MKIGEYKVHKHISANYQEYRKTHWPELIGKVDDLLKANGDTAPIEHTVDLCYELMGALDKIHGILHVMIDLTIDYSSMRPIGAPLNKSDTNEII